MFAASSGEITAGLSYVRLVASFTRHFVDAAFVEVVCRVGVSCFGSLLYCVCCFVCYLDVCVCDLLTPV